MSKSISMFNPPRRGDTRRLARPSQLLKLFAMRARASILLRGR
jgi:hypothetical protein